MFLIQNTLVSLDVLEKEFCCDLETCRGCCCIEGDAGAPLTEEEEKKIAEILPILLPDMTKEAKAVVEQQGIAYNDPSGERVTSIVNDKDCIFARTDHNGWCYCLIEKAYNAGKIDFKKPISCHLYPVRLLGRSRDETNAVMSAMAERGIATNVHYKPLPLMTAYKALGFNIGDYPQALRLYENELTLPLHTRLSDEDVAYVIHHFTDILSNLPR